jgi:hypothetical protein
VTTAEAHRTKSQLIADKQDTIEFGQKVFHNVQQITNISYHLTSVKVVVNGIDVKEE